MRVALVHDYIKEYGGAERVLEALHEIWPEAPVYTTVYLPEFLGPHRNRFENGNGKWEVRTSFLQFLPFKEKLISPIRIIAPFVFSRFDFKDYDVVIVSATGAYSTNTIKCKVQSAKCKITAQSSKLSNNKPSAISHTPIHFCYCHTPPRYLYGYATARDWKQNLIFRVLGEIANHFLRLVDFKSAQNVDYFIANSKNVASRIKKFYRRESTVIYPPSTLIDTDLKTDLHGLDRRKSALNQRESYFLCGGRLARPKHIDLIIETCVKLKVPLKVFGRGFAGYEAELSSKFKVQSSKLEFVGEITDEEKLELMRNAKAYIFASEDEDFGITPVEAMSVGTPVIAYRSGGVVESVIENRTGVFFDKLSVGSLSGAINHFNNLNYFSMRENCIKQAEKFSRERFKRAIKNFIESKMNK